MASSREVLMLNGWAGGLNLTDAAQFIQPNESPDCLNVVFDDRGGFSTRHGYRTLNTSASTKLDGDATFLGTLADVFQLALDDGNMGTFNGTAVTDTGVSATDTPARRPRAAVFNANMYMTNLWTAAGATLRVARWTGSAITFLTQTFNDNYAVPTSGNMPKARLVAAHNGYLWVADTEESGVRYHSRVRFSHVGQPENWATNDYFDVGPTDSTDPITALLPWRGMLLVFKREAVYMIGGYDRDSFYYDTISLQGGCSSQQAVTTNSGVAYWVSNEGNVFAYNGEKPVPIGERIRRIWDTNQVDVTKDPCVEWFQGRLWVSVPMLDASDKNATFVYDPRIGEGGAWTRFGVEMDQLMSWIRPGTDFLLWLPSVKHTTAEQQRICDFADRELSVDIIDAVNTPINAYLRTYWITAGETATKKRWRRPRLTLAATSQCTVTMEVYQDFNEFTVVKQDNLEILGAVSTSGVWDSSLWDSALWASPNELYEFERSSSLGSSNAIQLRFYSPNNTARWWIDSVALPFRRRQIR
jgi:hypothetical protein